MISITEFVDRAWSVPFEEKGRSYEGWDCWGLIYVAYRDIFNIILPEGTGEYHSTRRREEVQALIARRKVEVWELHDPHEPGDVAIVKMMGQACHIGLMLDGWNMLHVQHGVEAVIESINCQPWRCATYDKVEGIYRHVDRS